ncbi:RDD family protein [Pusillimonas sp.]|uniref:RDD family protein n=1 Tax=Pusillimonas sp. TaxID=3040095 RepID=UPI0037CB3F42
MPHTTFLPGTGHTAAVPSRWRLFASMMYEGVLLFAVVFLAGYLLDTLTQSRSGLTLRGLRQGVLFLAIGAYFIMCWRYSGQTLPMKTWNIRLVDQNGHTPTLKRLMLRYVLLWPIPLLAALLVQGASHLTGYRSTDLLIVFTPFTIFFWTWIDPDRQFLHDRLLGTRLIHTDAKTGK